MKILAFFLSAFLILPSAWSAPKTANRLQTKVVSSPATTSSETDHTLAFNFVGLSQGKANIYLDVGGISDWIAPSLSYRSYSNKEPRKKMDNRQATVDRSLATIGPSLTFFKRSNKSLIVNPYLFFGLEKDAANTENVSGIGGRVIGQFDMTKTFALQLGLDGNNMESAFKTDAYFGVGISL